MTKAKAKAKAKNKDALPRASFRRGEQLTHDQCKEFQRLKGQDGKGKFQFADDD